MDRACTQCQRRKTRCLGANFAENRPCTYCTKFLKECVSSEKTQRTPLTRKNLEDTEARCRDLESQIAELQKARATDVPVSTAEHAVVSQNVELVSSRNGRNKRRRISANGDIPASTPINPPHTWSEVSYTETPLQSRPNRGDGTATLTVATTDSGYLGTSSGQALLRSIISTAPKATSVEPTREANHVDTAQGNDFQPQQGLTTNLRITDTHLAVTHIKEQLITIYFDCYNSCYPILHERAFRKQHKELACKSPDSGHYLTYLMVLAIGEWIGGFTDPQEESLYFEVVRNRFCAEFLESGSIEKLQSLLLISNYLQKQDRLNTAYTYLGIAHRMAIGLGLHKELSRDSRTQSLSDHRRRVIFWTLYCFDSGFSITTGRPLTLSDSFIDISMPKNIADREHQSDSDSMLESASPTTYSALIAQARLAKIANKAYSQFMGTIFCTDPESQIPLMEYMLSNWRMSLPIYFTEERVPVYFRCARSVVLWKEMNIRILLLLAGQRQVTDMCEKFAIGKRYQTVAVLVVEEIHQFTQSYESLLHRGFTWYAIYFLLQAVLALSVHEVARIDQATLPLTEQDDTQQGNYDESMQRAQECLVVIGRRDQLANRAMSTLDQLKRDVHRKRTERSDNQVTASQPDNTMLSDHDLPTSTERLRFDSFWNNDYLPMFDVDYGNLEDLFESCYRMTET